jgi:predicted Zn-dependent protease
MMDKTRREELAQRVLARSKAEQTEAIVQTEDFGLTRFTHNAVHQNISETNTTLRVRAIVDGRAGVVTTNATSDDGIDAALTRALDIARIVPPDEGFVPLERTTANEPGVQGYFASTAAATPEQRARMAADVFAVSKEAGLWAAGYVRTSSSGITIANSAGARLSYDGTEAVINVKQNGADSTGYAEHVSPDVAHIDAGAVARHAAGKALASRAPAPVEPGPWTVVIEPAAFGELLAFLNGHFSAQTVEEGGSFITEGLGVKYLAESLSIREDYAHPEIAGMPFDYQGYPTQRLDLVELGVVSHVVTDAYWARKLNVPNTGHGLPAPNGEGPMIRNLVVAPGTKSTAELIAGVERGLLITRFWYIRTVDQKRAIVTGMTRDGTFLIENGRVTRGVNNLRFNESIVSALSSIECSSERARTNGFYYNAVVPAVRIDNFTFSSSTEF